MDKPISLKQNIKIDFLRAKADLIIGNARDEQGRTMLTTFFAWIDGYKQMPSVPAETFRRADELLEGLFEVFNPEIREQFEAKLREQFGVTRLGRPPKSLDDLIEKVLKTGKIRTDNDAELVEEFVANTTNVEVVGTESYQRLGGILDSYQCEARRLPRKSK